MPILPNLNGSEAPDSVQLEETEKSALPEAIEKPELLIGEGKEEVRFFKKLLKELGMGDVQVEHYSGVDGLAAYLHAQLARTGYDNLRALGVTRDADANAENALKSVCGALTSAGMPAPKRLGEAASGPPRVSVFILPDGNSAGMLEDLCLSSVASDPGIACVDAYLDCVKEAAKREPKNRAKARVHAWLATQQEPGKRLGEAAEADYWPLYDPAFDSLKRFLRSL